MQFVTFLAFNLYHYISLVYVRKKIMHRTLYDPESGLFSTRYFKLLAREKAEKATALTLVGIKISNSENLTQQFTIDQIAELTKEITSRLRRDGFLSKKDMMASVSPGVIGVLKEDQKKDQIRKGLEIFIASLEGKEWKLDDRRVQVSLKGLLLNKAAGERIQNCDPVSQMKLRFKNFDDTQSVYCEPINRVEINSSKSRIDVRNEYDFIVLDWEEKAKDLAKSLRALSEANARLSALNFGIVKTLARSIDANSTWTAGHSERVTRTAVKLGKTMGLGDQDQKRLQIGGLLHDIGKIGIPTHILDKHGKLTDEEFTKIREHPAKGARILEPLEQLSDVIPLIEQHHERFDGMGYPYGLAGSEIDPCARIIAVADVFDALRMDRPYRSGMPLEDVVVFIKDGSGTQFDPDVVAAFLQFIAPKVRTQPISGKDRLNTQPSIILDKPGASIAVST
jgi:putative nucleotidyltransferase with HDIG domain